MQKSVAIELSSSPGIPGDNVTYFVSSLPPNGILSFDEGKIQIPTVPAALPNDRSTLYFTPEDYFSGNVSFNYYARSSNKSSRDAVASISIAFTNQRPLFRVTSLAIPINESSTFYSIDLMSLIFDPDEKQSFIFEFEKKPSRGKWTTNGKLANFDEPLILLKGAQNVLQIELDGKGGQNPYFDFSGKVTDTYNATTTNSLEVSGAITCGIANSLNTWTTGAVCQPCPVGAIW